jgi:predicted nucleic acid-binding protein
MIALDTSALSLFLRRPQAKKESMAQLVEQLILEDRALLFGIVRQEVLSGIKSPEQFSKLKQQTKALPLVYATEKDHILAAEFYNTCRSHGVQGSSVDFLICAMAKRLEVPILTTDPDFSLYEPLIGIELLPL